MKEKKGAGFVATWAGVLLAVLTAVVYSAIYASTRYMSWKAVGFIAAGAVVTALLLLMGKLLRFAPSVLFATFTVGTMFFIYHIYFFISSVMVGIQFSGFPPEFFVTAVLYGLTLVVSIIAVFLPMKKG